MADWDVVSHEPAPADDSGWDVATPPTPIGAAMVSSGPQLPQQGQPWSDVALNFAKHLPRSLWNDVAVPTWNAVTNPQQTVPAMANLAAATLPPSANPDMAGGAEGMTSNVGAAPDLAAAREARLGEGQAARDAVVNDYKEAYGGEEKFKKTLSEHPARFLMDATLPFSLAPSVPGRVGQVARLVDPVVAAGKTTEVAGDVARAAGAKVFGRDVANAGRAGLDNNKAFGPNFTGKAELTDVVKTAKSALSQIRQDRGNAYRSGMVDISKDRSILDFDPIDEAVGKADSVAAFTPQGGVGKVRLNPSAAETNKQLATIVNDWKTLNPKSDIFKEVPPEELTAANYHTPEGLDALKRIVGDVRSSSDVGTPSFAAADRVYNAIHGQIEAQAPAYAKIMEGYSKASDDVKNIEKTLSLGDKASKDTALRKLQSTSRNNVNTNYGARTKLVDELAKKEPDLPFALAGQALNSYPPRGLVGKMTGSMGGLAAGGHAMMNGLDPHALMQLAYMAPLALAFSPKVRGAVAYGGGRAIGATRDAAAAMGVNGETIGSGVRGAYRANEANQGSPPQSNSIEDILKRLNGVMPFSLSGGR